MASWRDGARAYPYPFERGVPFSLPDRREARRGTLDLGRDAWRARGRRLSMRRDLETLERNPRENGRRRWTLVDSFGRRVAILERHSNRWDVENPFAGRTLYRDRSQDIDQIHVQGRACMVTEALERRHALIAFRANDRASLDQGESIVPFGVRAFIDRRALPPRNLRGQVIRGAVDAYDVGCGGSDLPLGPSAPLIDAGFLTGNAFLGEDGIERTYTTYNAKAPYGGLVYVLANTTGVFGGGIVRGVVRAGDSFRVADAFGYCDPNVPAGASPLARWRYGRVGRTRLWGWVAERC